MVNIVSLALFTVVFLAISFVVRNVVLQQEFDIVNEVIVTVTTLALVWVASFVTQKAFHKQGVKVSV